MSDVAAGHEEVGEVEDEVEVEDEPDRVASVGGLQTPPKPYIVVTTQRTLLQWRERGEDYLAVQFGPGVRKTYRVVYVSEPPPGRR